MDNFSGDPIDQSSAGRSNTLSDILTDYGAWDWDIVNGDLQWFGIHERVAGARAGSFSGKVEAFSDVLHPDDRSRVWDKVRDLTARQEVLYTDEYRVVRSDGSVHHIQATGRFKYDEAGRAVRLVGMMQDVTERKRWEKALRESEERFAKAFRASPHPIGITEVETGRCVEVNDACLQLFGFRREEVIGNTTLALGIWPDPEDRTRLVERLKAGGPVRNLELSFKTKAGEKRHILVSSELAELNGTFCLVTIGNDITERKLAEAKLRESEERLRLAQSAANIGTFDWDMQSQTIVWSPETERIWGLPVGGFEGAYEHWLRQVHPDDVVEVERMIRLSLENPGIPQPYEHRIIRPDGTVRWIHANATTRSDTTGRPIRMVGVNFDITGRKQAEKAMRENECWQSGQKEAFQAAMTDAPLQVSLGALVRTAVQYFGGDARAAFYLVDDDGASLTHVVGMSEAYARAVEGPPRGPESLACDLAVNRGEPVITSDVTRDPRWEPWLWLAREHRYRACWSFPARTADGPVLGMSALYFSEPRQPTPRDLELADVLANAATMIIARYREVSERARMEQALRESEARFRTMAEAVPSFLFETDAAGWNTWTSEGWCRFTGQTPEQVAGHGWADALHPDDRAANIDRWLQCMQDKVPFEAQQRLRRTDGTYAWVIARALPVRDHEGKVSRWVGSVTDVEAIVRAEVEQARLAAIVESTGDAVIGHDARGLITSWNRGAETLLGYTAGEAIGRSVTMLFPPDRLDEEPAFLDRLRDGGSIRQYETVRRCKDGRDIHVAVTISPIKDKQGRVIGASKILRDITARKQAEEQLRESHHFISEMTAVLPGVLYIFDLERQRNVYVNRHTGAVLGYSAEDIHALGDDFIPTVLHPDDAIRLLQHFEGLKERADGISAQVEYRLRHRDGSYRWFLSRDVVWERDAEGRVRQILGLATDITERKQAEEKLRDAQQRLRRWNQELEQAVNKKTAELTHSQKRLRALASELSLTEQRERTRLAAELHDHLQQMLVYGKMTIGQGKRRVADVPGAAEAMTRVDDVLTEALTYSRTLVAELSPPVLHDHGLAAGLKWLGDYMRKYGQTVTVLVPDNHELNLPEADRVLLFQSVRELLINASKHAGTDKAVVRMERHDANLYVTVSDEGEGFDPAAVTSATAGIPSGGISSKFGLFSIQERMRALGGSFTVQSAPGKGTTATLVLPLARNAEDNRLSPELSGASAAREGTSAEELGPLTKGTMVQVLLVDDHAMVRQGLRSVLDAYDDLHVVAEARDGAEAVKLVGDLRPRVVVMDINMPRMNGIDATTHIKTRWPETTVIGISVNTGDDVSDAMKRAGAATVLPKDTAVDQLHDAIVQEVGDQWRVDSGE